MADSVKDAHCSFCGHPFPPDAGWPRTCAACGRVSYRNPLPVAVALQPVRTGSGTGLVVVRRSIPPGRGELALPGGFVDVGESWQRAVVRELSEETRIEAAEADVRLAGVRTDLAGYLLVFGLLPPRDAAALPASAPTDETHGWQVLHAPEPLCFPLHTEAADEWFAERDTPDRDTPDRDTPDPDGPEPDSPERDGAAPDSAEPGTAPA